MCITRKTVHSQKNTEIRLIGNSNIKWHVCKLKPLLSSNYKIYSVLKPESTTSELKETAKIEISLPSHDD